jgi:dTDP-glucose 4,6-dehydratase
MHIPEEYHGAPNPLDPASAYGEGKRVVEHLCSLYADSDLEVKIARCFAFVGPYLPLNAHFAIGNFIRDAINGGPIIIKGDGTPHRSYLYAADLVIWLWAVLLHGKSVEPYNVGSMNSISIAELATIVANEFGGKIDIVTQATPDHQRPISRYIPNTKKSERNLNLKQTCSLQESIARTKNWYKSSSR